MTKAAVLMEALPYIQRFRGSIFVVKYGGSFMDDPDPEVSYRVVSDMVFLHAVGIHVVLVHGGGKAISRAMEEAGLKPVFNMGLRVTDEASVQVVDNTLNNEVNLDICEKMQVRGGSPLGIKGNSIIECEKLVKQDDAGNDVDLGYVGSITKVHTQKILKAIEDGYTPVVSPVATDIEGHPYNINADTAAGAVAAALRARRLVYLCDVPGLMRDPNDPDSLISTLPVNEVDKLIADGIIAKGMLPKVESAVKALQQGVRRVHFIDGRVPHSTLLEIFTYKGIGTEIINAASPWTPEQEAEQNAPTSNS